MYLAVHGRLLSEQNKGCALFLARVLRASNRDESFSLQYMIIYRHTNAP